MSSQLQHDKTPSPRSLVPDGALKLVCYDANDESDKELESRLRLSEMDSSRHLDSNLDRKVAVDPRQLPILELSEVVCTLLSYGFDAQDINEESCKALETYLKDQAHDKSLKSGSHWTLSAQLALILCNRRDWDADFEPNDPISTGAAPLCLRSMLRSPGNKPQISQMQHLAKAICKGWSTMGLKAKTPNDSPFYAALNETQALLDLLSCWETGDLAESFHEVVYASIITAFQYLVKLLKTQNADGSWGKRSSLEESAYGLLAVIRLSGLPFLESLADAVLEAIERGRNFLTSGYPKRGYNQSPHLWTESATFGSANVGEAYTLAALRCEPVLFARTGAVAELVEIPFKRLPDLGAFYISLPMFKTTKAWIIQASLIEGYLLLPLLRQNYNLYPEKDSFRWLEYISFVFSACNNINEAHGVSTGVLVLVMGLMSILYQIDAFMESLLEKGLIRGLAEIVGLIHETFDLTEENNTCGVDLLSWSRGSVNLSPKLRTPPVSPGQSTKNSQIDYFTTINGKNLDEARSQLNKFVRYLLDHAAIAAASPHDRHWFKTELYEFFMAQAGQVAEKATLERQVKTASSPSNDASPSHDSSRVYTSSTQTYHRWVRSTGANSVGSPYQFAFFSIVLASGTGRDCWESVEEKYLAQSASQGLAAVWRIENDIGGIVRDRLDCTVNSVNFPEFAEQRRSDEELKAQLMILAGHERRQWKADMMALRGLVAGDAAKEGRLDNMRVFTDAMELYGQIYIKRDVWKMKADE